MQKELSTNKIFIEPLKYRCDFCSSCFDTNIQECPRCGKLVSEDILEYKIKTPIETLNKFVPVVNFEKGDIPVIKKKSKGFWYYLIGIIIIIGYIWLIANSGGNRFGCYEDRYGNEICREDPRT